LQVREDAVSLVLAELGGLAERHHRILGALLDLLRTERRPSGEAIEELLARARLVDGGRGRAPEAAVIAADLADDAVDGPAVGLLGGIRGRFAGRGPKATENADERTEGTSVGGFDEVEKGSVGSRGEEGAWRCSVIAASVLQARPPVKGSRRDEGDAAGAEGVEQLESIGVLAVG
jgi:hypothetical protein